MTEGDAIEVYNILWEWTAMNVECLGRFEGLSALPIFLFSVLLFSCALDLCYIRKPITFPIFSFPEHNICIW